MQFTFKLLTAAILAEQGVNALELQAQEKSASVHAPGPYSVPEAYRVYANPTPHLQGYGRGYGGYGGHGSSYGNSGYGNTGYGNTGYGSTSHGNTGYGNTGYGNTGYGSTSYGNTGYGNTSRGYGGNSYSGNGISNSYGHGNSYGSGYSKPSTGYSHCDADCEAKVGEVKDAMKGKLQDTADTCVENAEALREEIVGEIRALREKLSQEAKDKAQTSVDKLSDQVDMDLAMLLDTFNTLKGEIDEEKHSIAEKIEKLAWETKSKISKLKGYSGRGIGSYGGYNRHANSGYNRHANSGYIQPRQGYSAPSSHGYGVTDVNHGGYGPSTSEYGFGEKGGIDTHRGSNYGNNRGSNYGSNHGAFAVPAKGYLGFGDPAYSTGPIEKKNEGPHPGLYSALLFAQTEKSRDQDRIIVGGPQTYECADGSEFECNAGTQGCYPNSSTYCEEPVELMQIVGGPETLKCADGSEFECNAGTFGCFADSPTYCEEPAELMQIVGGPETFKCADGSEFQCNAGTQGCFADSPTFCDAPDSISISKLGNHGGAYDDVNALIEAFSEALEAKAAGFEQFVAERRETLAEQVAEKKTAFDALAAEELAGWNVEAAAAEKALAWQKAGKIHGFEQFFNKKLWAMDQSIKDLEWYFSDIFTKTLKQIDGEVDSYEVSALLKKANSKKQDFLKDVWAIRQGLKEAGIAIRDGLKQDLDDEWQALLDSLEESRNFLIGESARLAQALADGSQAIVDDLDMHSNHVSDWLDQRISWSEHQMEQFLHSFNGYLNQHSYQPRGYYQRGHGCARIGNYDAVIRGCGFGGGYGNGYSKGYSGYGSGSGYGPSPAKARALVGALIDFKNDH